MCGLIGGQVSLSAVERVLPLLHHRGPDAANAVEIDGWAFGHTRLGIQAIGVASVNQPYRLGDLLLTYNGEQWHPEQLPATSPDPGDTGLVAALLAEHGTAALPLLDGMWALAWRDAQGAVRLARDTFGEIPLHYGWTSQRRLVWCSELAPLLALGAVPSTVRWLEPGCVLTASSDGATTLQRWADPVSIEAAADDHEEASSRLRELFDEAVVSRMTSDAPVAILLSGGLDSSAIVSTLVEKGYAVHPYIAVHDERAADLKHARAIAQRFALDLQEVQVAAVTAADLRDAVRRAEMPYKAQVEISLGALALARQIAHDGFRVVLSGEGSDELWGSYGMSYHGIKAQGWGPYRRDLFAGQHHKNFPRVNKVFMAHSVEARMPFLHPSLVRYALRLTQDAVTAGGKHSKAVLAQAMAGRVPSDTAWRSKQAFQTQAGLDKAAAAAVALPEKFYRAEFRTIFKGVKP